MPIDDIIDRALDRAEEITAPDPVEPVEAPKDEEVEQSEPLAAEANEEQVTDGEANEGEVEAVESGAEVEKPAPVVDEPISLPEFLSAETKALLAEATPALRKKMVAEYEQREQTTRRALQESSRFKSEQAKIDEVIAPHKTKLAAQGIRDIPDLVSRALAWDELMTTDIKGFLRAQALQNGLTPDDIFGDAAEQSAPAQDPRVDEVRQEFEAYKLDQERTRLSAELESFKDGKDSTGVTRRTFVDLFAPQIGEAVALIKSDPQYAHLTNADVLHHAYEYAVGQARSGFQAVTPQQPKPAPTPEQIAKTTEKQKAAASSVRGAPASGISKPRPRLKGDTFEERLDSAIDKAISRTSANR